MSSSVLSKWFSSVGPEPDPEDNNYPEGNSDSVTANYERMRSGPSPSDISDHPGKHLNTRSRTPEGIIERVGLIKDCLNFCFRDCEKSEVFYFWMAMLNYLRVWFKTPRDLGLGGDRQASLAMDNLVASIDNAVGIWWILKTQRETGKSAQKLDLYDAEARMHCSFTQLLNRLNLRYKSPWSMTPWQYSEAGPKQEDDKKLPGRREDVCFWARFFGFNESVELSVFCQGLYLHLTLVEKQVIPLSLASFQQLVSLTLKPGAMTTSIFCDFVKRFGTTLNLVYMRMTGSAVIQTAPISPLQIGDGNEPRVVPDQKVEWPSWFTTTKSSDECVALLFPPNEQQEEGRDSGSEFDNDEDEENDQGEVEKPKFVVRISRDGETFVIHSRKSREPSKVQLLEGSYGWRGKSLPTLRDFLLDYLNPEWTKERQQLLQEQLAWRTQKDLWTTEHTPSFSDLGKFFQFRVHTLFEWITSDNVTEEMMAEEVNEAINSLMGSPPPLKPGRMDSASQGRFNKTKAVLDAELPTIQQTLQSYYWNYYSRKKVSPEGNQMSPGGNQMSPGGNQMSPEDIEPEAELAGLRKVLEAVNSYLDGSGTSYKSLDALLRYRDFRIFWIAVWELSSDSFFPKLINLTEKLADCLTGSLPRPALSSFWLKVASFSLYNKCKDIPSRRKDCQNPAMLTRLIQIFGKLIAGDSSAIALAAEFPIVGLFLDLLDSKDTRIVDVNVNLNPLSPTSKLQAKAGSSSSALMNASSASSSDVQWDENTTWTIEQVTMAATGIRKMVDFLAVTDEDSQFVEDENPESGSGMVPTDQFLNNKFKDPAMRERSVILLLDSGYLEHLATEVHDRWLARLKKWRDFRYMDENQDKDFRNFNYIGKGSRLNSLVDLSLELVALIQICLYSVYRSHLLIVHQKWLVLYMSLMVKLPGFDTEFITHRKLAPDRDRLRRVFDMHYAIADYMVRLRVNWGQSSAQFQALKTATQKMADNFKLRVVGAEVVTKDDKMNLYHCQLQLLPKSLHHNSNLVEMKEDFGLSFEPEDGGRVRQKKLTLALTDLAEMFLHQTELMEKGWASWVADHDQFFYKATLFLVFLVNIILVPTLERQDGGEPAVSKPAGIVIAFVSVFHALSAIFMTAAHFLDHHKYEYRRQRKLKHDQEEAKKQQNDNESNKKWRRERDERGRRGKRDREPEDPTPPPEAPRTGCGRITGAFYDLVGWEEKDLPLHLRSIFTPSFTWHVCYVLLALFALRWRLLLCFSLVFAVFKTDLAKTLLSALHQAIRGLLTAYAMGLAVVYGFASIAFWSRDMNGTYNFGNEDLQWNYFIGEVMAHFDEGLQGPPNWEREGMTGREGKSVGLFVWSFLYNIIIINVLVAIISGVVVDAFGQIRDRRNAQKEAALSHCLICNARREELDDKFEHHIRERHPLNNYLHLFIYASRHTAMEKHRKEDEKKQIAKLRAEANKNKGSSRAMSRKSTVRNPPLLGDLKAPVLNPVGHSQILLGETRSDTYAGEESKEVKQQQEGAEGGGGGGEMVRMEEVEVGRVLEAEAGIAQPSFSSLPLRPREDEHLQFDNLPILRMIQEQLRSGSGEFLPSWQLHQADLVSDYLDLHLEAELAATEEQFNDPHYWNLAMPRHGTCHTNP